MDNLFLLHNPIKHYEWGSPDFIPRLMGITGDGAPWAEMWMGNSSLPEQYGTLPFLFKLLAAEKPLSIQVHPNQAQAREGFDRENREGLPLDAPNRNYKDANHKPEIICALTPFTGMCGFRAPEEIHRLIANFTSQRHIEPSVRDTKSSEQFASDLLSSVSPGLCENKLRGFLETLFNLSSGAKQALTEFILSSHDREGEEWRLMQNLARLYPGDPAIIAPLYLNIFHLEPGEALFLQSGVPHAYIHGFGVELMTNSDNVLRGGLTSKHIDIPELMKVLDFNPSIPRIIQPEPGATCFTYPTPCTEFALTVVRGTGDTKTHFVPNGPSICIVTEGEVSVSGMLLKQGQSAFIPGDGAPLTLQGHYTLYSASVPQ